MNQSERIELPISKKSVSYCEEVQVLLKEHSREAQISTCKICDQKADVFQQVLVVVSMFSQWLLSR